VYQAQPEGKEMLDCEDVANYLGVRQTTVQRWCREGKLRSLKIGKAWRIRRDELEDFLKRNENSANYQ
jgi:excisionase family DNA binding protein